MRRVIAYRRTLPVNPSPLLSLVPVIFLLLALIVCILTVGADRILDLSPILLVIGALLTWGLTLGFTSRNTRLLKLGLRKSASQILPAIPILILIGTLSATWMVSGVVPMFIDYGLRMLSPGYFLPLTCAICACISVLTGSSWTTIATMGVAFMGIGTVMGYSAAWIAGAIISGAYFGDKVSPLSDTTVLAAGSLGVDLFDHIRNMTVTTAPAIAIALGVFAVVGWNTPVLSGSDNPEIHQALASTFNLTPYLLVVPAITLLLIMFRVNTTVTLGMATLSGLVAALVWQPQLLSGFYPSLQLLLTGSGADTGQELLDNLLQTSGAKGMLPTIMLVLMAILFGGALIGSGMLTSLTRHFLGMLRKRHHLVGATAASGLFLNATTGDQYVSLIIGANLYRKSYARAGLRPNLLSRTLEDSVSVTSVLIPWNSCGMTQSTVLGVSTLTYLPCCIFNLLSPVMSVVVATIAHRMARRRARRPVMA